MLKLLWSNKTEVKSLNNIGVSLVNILSALLFIGLSLPFLQGRIKMNSLYGIRFPKSFKSEEAWVQINRFGSKQLILWSVPLLMSGIIFLVMPPISELFTTLLVFLPCVTILPPVVISYIYSTKL